MNKYCPFSVFHDNNFLRHVWMIICMCKQVFAQGEKENEPLE